MFYMIIERFRNRDAGAVYARFRERGRMAPADLTYVASWVETNWDRCFQVMECEDPALLATWMAAWADLVDFEIVPVVTSADAARAMAPAAQPDANK